jgi:hypothetical protein
MMSNLNIPTLIQINALYPAYTYQHKLLVAKDPRSNPRLVIVMAKALEALGLDLTGHEPPSEAGIEFRSGQCPIMGSPCSCTGLCDPMRLERGVFLKTLFEWYNMLDGSANVLNQLQLAR